MFRTSPRWDDADLVWRNIANDDIYHPSLCKISKVRNPTVRYALRILSNTMFARPQSCLAKEEELQMVYAATQRWLNNRYGKPLNRAWMWPEVGSWLLNQIFKAKHDAIANPDYQICIGGLLTPIFTACGIDLKLHRYFQHIPKMDFDYLVTTHTLAGRLYPNTLVYRYMEDEDTPLLCFLPQLKYSAADCVKNLQFSLPRDQVVLVLNWSYLAYQSLEDWMECEEGLCRGVARYWSRQKSRGAEISHESSGFYR
ncbi:unnamed protein product [Arabis nemorensis]|uniref:Arabidopsis retrotransposon Orf1 C-terminal domain-containing protein n=1 Tax=Arabis nemorensis TaxID=586526 RepID=A0A565AW80_9BRAS|nr:unnamed protein product [Arabis nemorensis]